MTALLTQGMTHQQYGRLDAAAACYRQVLAKQGKNADALHLLGLTELAMGRREEGVNHLREAVTIQDHPVFRNSLGVALREMGDWSGAEMCFRAVTRQMPTEAGGFHNLGLLLLSRGRLAEAEVALRQAVTLHPGHAEARANLAAALKGLGRLAEGAEQARAALALAPGHPPVLELLGNILLKQKHHQEAAACFQQALTKMPQQVTALNGLAMSLRGLKKDTEAEPLLRQALILQPGYAEAHHNLGLVLLDAKLPAAAEASFRAAVQQAPQNPAGHHNLGLALKAQGRRDEALACFRQTLALHPDYLETLNTMGILFKEMGRLAEAEEVLRHALTVDPSYFHAINSLGNILRTRGDLDEAEACFRHALIHKPDYAHARYNLGMLKLTRGEWREGWVLHEDRLLSEHSGEMSRDLPMPEWLGEPLGARALLVWGEQGMGDKIQFWRYLRLLRQAHPAATLGYVCPRPLWRLFEPQARAWGVTLLESKTTPGFPVHCALMSLPHRFATEPDTVPRQHPRLTVPEPSPWQGRWSGLPRPRVGLVWRGNPDHQEDRQRSIPIATLAPLAAVPGIHWVNLTLGATPAEWTQVPGLAAMTDWMGQVTDFADTAALMEGLDLIIGVDTSVIHLAAAMDKPTWLLNRIDSDWRWGLAGESTPWYPSLRIFRQERLGSWEGVVARVAAALSRLLQENEEKLS